MAFDTATYLSQLHSKSLNDLLDQLEVDLSHLGQGNEESAFLILLKLDYAFQEITEISQKNLPVKTETAQFEYLVSGLEKNAKAFLKDIGGGEKLEHLRKANLPKKEQTWWYLDEFRSQEMKKTFQSITLTAAIIIGVLLILSVVYRLFLMPDPKVSAAYGHQVNAEQAISQDNFEKALAETNMALSYTPDDTSLLILRAVIEQKLGMSDLSTADFSAAEEKLGNHETFLITRAQLWLQTGDFSSGLVDAQEVVKMDPNSAEGYFFMGHAYEMQQNFPSATHAYTKASELAEAQGKTELNGTIRVTMAMMMQSMPIGSTPLPQTSPSPAQK